jgi:PPR repeat
MTNERIRPNSITFIAVLAACSRSGLVDEGLRHFYSMRKDYKFIILCPSWSIMHVWLICWAVLVRFLKHVILLKKMHVNPDRSIWGALMGACRMHGKLDIAEFVERDLFESGYDDVNYYLLLTNIYGDVGRWQNAEALRKTMA